jgi:glucose-1-phosphate adenylyltransferase
MDDFTIISYPGTKDASLLSLTENRSRYMLPFGGRFRVVDFTIRNSQVAGARHTIIYNNYEDDLAEYVENYGPYADMKFPPVKVVSREFSDIRFCYNLIMDSNTHYYIIYNGDNPSIIDFADLVERYKKKKVHSALFLMHFSGRESMAYTILVTNQKSLLSVVNRSIDEAHHAPNLFEMIINIMINRGIKKDTADVYYRPVRSIPEYYQCNMDIMENKRLFELVHGTSGIRSQIRCSDFASVGRHGKIMNSFVSDGCKINGTLQNSIVFPGVEIGEKCVIKDSIILPYNRIGDGTTITRTVVDESVQPGVVDGTVVPQPESIGAKCRIGSEHEQLKNNAFPKSIYRSITLIGKNSGIPEGSRVGGACYVSSGEGRGYFEKSKYLYDGLSVVKQTAV